MTDGAGGARDHGPVRGRSAPPTEEQAASDSILIFISYRRDDTAGYAGRLYDSLSSRFRPQQLFMDVDTIELGVDFVEVIENAVGRCDVLLALIGPDWLKAADAFGARRLDNPRDFVRLEVESALARGIRVIPVLLERARMPDADSLPDALKPLARRNAIELTHGRWRSDVERLVASLEAIDREKKKAAAAAAAHAAAEAKAAEDARAAEEARKAEEVREADEARKAEEKRRADEARKADEARSSERARVARARGEREVAPLVSRAGAADAKAPAAGPHRRRAWPAYGLPPAPVALVGAGGLAALLVAGVLAAGALNGTSATPTPARSVTAGSQSPGGSPGQTASATPVTGAGTAAATADGCIPPPADRPIVYWRFPADPSEGEAYELDLVTGGSEPLYERAADDDFFDSFPVLSPTGDRTAVARRPAGGARDIWVVGDSGSGENVTEHPADDWFPAWAPNGQWLAFASGRGDPGGIYAIHIDSGADQLIDDAASTERAPVWSPDGSAIAYWSDRSGSPDLYVVEIDGVDGDGPLGVGEPRRVTDDPDAELVPSWSPDGSRLLFAYGPNTSRDVHVLDLATGTSTPLIETADVREDSPAWSPDGRLVTFFRGAPDDYAIWVANADGSCQRQLTPGGRNDIDPRWR